MTTTEKKYVEKLEEYITHLSVLASSHCYECRDFKSELSALKSELKEVPPIDLVITSKITNMANEFKVVKEEQSLSAEEVLKILKRKIDVAGQNNANYAIETDDIVLINKTLHSFRDQGRDWEKIEQEFQIVVDSLASDYDEKSNYKAIQRAGKEFFNWFKQHSK